MYLLDANVFIQAKNGPYGMDFAPGFWEWIEQAHEAGRVFTVAKVKDELKVGGDELAEWVNGLPSTFALDVDAAATPSLTQLARWAASKPNYAPVARAEFLSAADYYLVAQAHALGYTVVTHEQPSPDSRKRILIPDACRGLGVPWMAPWRMLRDGGARFVLPDS
jgi:hypothetical protein